MVEEFVMRQATGGTGIVATARSAGGRWRLSANNARSSRTAGEKRADETDRKSADQFSIHGFAFPKIPLALAKAGAE
jgi:hypothetical protein